MGTTAAALTLAIAGCSVAPWVSAQAVPDAQRGRLLYDAHCSACHTAQAHWRDRHVVQSWSGLVGEITRWQKSSGQNWSDAEIGDVAVYLNSLYYKLPCPSGRCQGARAAL
jgi:mono/diheme cytochrome c family protein